ncbi:ABC transporter substrate-binding protein [Paenibacillus thalictri]|uniref:Extracellular solute-binding protein n=1 Tax=Paenibacillus thalictri TaxID=2527873 RepID=A0A4V2J441_9BACL|nr:extracellular solute-binding protein [Paenibacillus thalictri]TBL77659.1 extracellular solute-binding protein [Paenibacillus thalictri]
MKLQKLNLMVSSLAAISMLTAACSSGSQAQKETAQQQAAKSGKPVQLKFWGGVPPESGPQQVIDNWNKEHPDIQVEYVRYVNDDPGNLKLDTALMTGQGVDLYVNYYVPRLEKRVKAGNALDLSTMKDYDVDAKIGAEAKDWKIDSKYYAIPTKKNNYFMWLNKDAFDQAGIPIPTEWTWEDLQAYAKKLKQGDRWGMLQTLLEFDYPMDGSIEGSGGNVKADGSSNLADPNAKRYLEIMYNMMHVDMTTPTMGEQISKKMPVEAEFLKGNSGIFYGGDWIFRFANNLKDYPHNFKIAFAPLPKVSANQTGFKSMGGVGDAISINSASQHKEEAWQFLKWYADGGMLPMAMGGRVPASSAIDQSAVLKLLTTGAEQTYDNESLKKVLFDPKKVTFQLKLDQQVIDARKEEYQKYFTKTQSLDATMDRIVKRHTDFLQQNKK